VEGNPDEYGYPESIQQHVAPINLVAVISLLNKKELALEPPTVSPGLTKYAETAVKIEKEKLDHYKKAIDAQKKSEDHKALVPVSRQLQTPEPIEEPLPANPVEPYDADIFGLEVAARACRFEMIKIVREV
jgi:hypothetical protein